MQKVISPNSHAILVLGMHRSGTSALTRVLNLLGIELGDKFLPKHVTNETGFWEHLDIVEINERILQQLDSAWFDTAPLPASWWTLKSIVPLRQQISHIIRRNFAKQSLWGIKDPRLCRLLPLWLPLLQELGIVPHCIIITRHPLEVAASLEKRDGISYNTSLRLWLEYVLTSIQDSQACPRVFVTYDELLQNWPTTITKIAVALKLEWPHQVELVAHEIDTFLNPNLKHHYPAVKIPYVNETLLAWSHTVYQDHVSHGNIKHFEVLNSIRAALHSASNSQPSTPKFHLLINLHRKHSLTNTLAALRCQDYSNWYLSIIADFSCTDDIFWDLPNVRWIQIAAKNLAIKTINHEISIIKAEWVALLEAGDSFAPQLFSLCFDHIASHPNWQFVYVDEDSVSVHDKHFAPQFKPDFNLDLLRAMPYVGHFCLLRRTAQQQVGGYTSGLENYAIAFKILEYYGEEAIGHIPKLLYHHLVDDTKFLWFPKSQRANSQKILQQHFQRQKINAKVYPTDCKNIYRIKYALQHNSLVSIIILTRNGKSSLQRCLTSLLKNTSYNHYEIIIVDNNSDDIETLIYLATLQTDLRFHLWCYEKSLSEINNLMAARGGYLLFLNDDTEIIQPDWLQRLLALNQRQEVGIVAARILDSQRRILHAGYILGMGNVGIAGQINQGLAPSDLGYMGRAQATQNLAAVSDSCMMIRKSLYQQVAGMDTDNTVLFNDVDLCLKVTAAGFKIVWTPDVTLLQHGAGSLVRNRKQVVDNIQLNKEIATMYARWLPQLCNDPSYNPNLSLNDKEWQPETQVNVPWVGKPALHSKVKRIVAFPHDSWGCGEYRVRAPLRVLQQLGLIEFGLMPNDEVGKMPTVTEFGRMQADTLLLHNALHDTQLNALRQYKRFKRCFKIFGQDDLIYALPKQNPYSKTNYKDIKQRVHLAISLCERLLVTTEPLREAYHHIADDIVIVPNYIEHARWQDLAPQRLTSAKPRVGWAGAAQHYGDLKLIVPVVKALAKEVDWIFLGAYPEELRPYVHESHSMVPFSQYPAKLASLNLDLAIAPLEQNIFNEAKSNLRLLEYGILGYPVVCSDIYPYQQAPVKRVTDNAWLEAVRERIYDLDAAFKEGQELKQWVIKNWLLEDHVTEWGEALNCLNRGYRTLPYANEIASTPQWIFILGNEADFLTKIIGKHEVIDKFDITKLSIPPLDKAVKIPLLWTEKEALVRLAETSKPVFELELDDKYLVVENLSAAMSNTLWLQQNFPNAYFIHIVRNGYAVALDIQAQVQQDYGVTPLLLHRAARQWQRSIEILQEDAPKLNHFLEIRYEDLLANPEKVVGKIWQFLHLTPPANLTIKPEPSRNKITPEQRAVIKNCAGKMLNYYNY